MKFLTVLACLAAACLSAAGGEPIYATVKVCDGIDRFGNPRCHYESRIVGYTADVPKPAKPSKGPASQFAVGDQVKHAANANDWFPAGTGTVAAVTPWNTGDGYSYQVRCDYTGKILEVNFKASELSLVAKPLPKADGPSAAVPAKIAEPPAAEMTFAQKAAQKARHAGRRIVYVVTHPLGGRLRR